MIPNSEYGRESIHYSLNVHQFSIEKKCKDIDNGQNGPLPSILEIICSETLFPNYIAMYHFFGPIAAFS